MSTKRYRYLYFKENMFYFSKQIYIACDLLSKDYIRLGALNSAW